MFRTVCDQVSLWEAVLPEELLRLPDELARVDALLDDEAFFGPFEGFFDPRIGRPSTPMETYLRLMFLKFRYRLGYETLCREVSDSFTWRRFCRIPFDGAVPHPTTLMKLTTRCGSTAVNGLNRALLAKAVEAKVVRTGRVRADTTVVPANVAYPTDSGLLDGRPGDRIPTWIPRQGNAFRGQHPQHGGSDTCTRPSRDPRCASLRCDRSMSPHAVNNSRIAARSAASRPCSGAPRYLLHDPGSRGR